MSLLESECSGSVSPSELCSDELEVSRASAANSPNNPQLANDSPKDVEVEETTKGLTEKLSAALLSILTKENLVKQHAKVAEDALLGWEKSEKEVASLKQQLKAALQKNSSLDARLGHLDDALKECVRQLRLSKEEQEEKIQYAIIKKTCEWESHKSELETHLVELQAQLEAKTESQTSFNHDLCLKIEILEKENASLKDELISLNEVLHARTLEMEFSIRAAETASKQHLESIKKVAKLEAECRNLRARIPKSSLPNDNKLICNSLYGESLTDSQSDSADRSFALDNELSVPDSWASALIAELDQFKNEKTNSRNLSSPIEIDLMDDFLEMERLAALTEADYGSSCLEHEADLDVAIPRHSSPTSNLESMGQHMALLEEKIEKMTIEKREMEMSLDKTNSQLNILQDELIVAEAELVELHGLLNLVSGDKHTLEVKIEILEANRKCMELELEAAHKEIGDLKQRLKLSEEQIEVEKPFTEEITKRCQNMEALVSESKEIGIENVSAYMEITKSQDHMSSLQKEIEENKIFSEECACSYQTMDTTDDKKEELNSQVEPKTLELPELHETFDITEWKPKKVFSAQLIADCPSMEAIGSNEPQVDYKIDPTNLKVHKLQEKAKLLETEVEEGTPSSTEFESDIDSLGPKKIELVVQLELEQREVRKLQEKVHMLEKQIEKAKTLSVKFATRCTTLEYELSRTKQADINQQSANSNQMPKIRQENDVTEATGRLAKCQKTIATLNLQMKSLETLDDFLLESKTPETIGETKEPKAEPKMLNFCNSPEMTDGYSALSNGTQESSMSESPETSSPSRSDSLIHNQCIYD